MAIFFLSTAFTKAKPAYIAVTAATGISWYLIDAVTIPLIEVCAGRLTEFATSRESPRPPRTNPRARPRPPRATRREPLESICPAPENHPGFDSKLK